MKYLTEIQQEIIAWRKYNFPKSNSDEQFLGMVEELGELAHAKLKLQQNIRQETNDIVGSLLLKERDALGDLLIYFINYCSMRGISVTEVLNDTWDEVKQRDWIKYPFDGRTK